MVRREDEPIMVPSWPNCAIWLTICFNLGGRRRRVHLELPTTPLTLQRLQIAERRRRPGAGIDGMGVSVSLSGTQSGCVNGERRLQSCRSGKAFYSSARAAYLPANKLESGLLNRGERERDTHTERKKEGGKGRSVSLWEPCLFFCLLFPQMPHSPGCSWPLRLSSENPQHETLLLIF